VLNEHRQPILSVAYGQRIGFFGRKKNQMQLYSLIAKIKCFLLSVYVCPTLYYLLPLYFLSVYVYAYIP